MSNYHYVQNQQKLMMQSQENDQKPQFGHFFDNFEVKYSPIGNFSEKQVSLKLKVIFSTNFQPKTKKVIRTIFDKNIKVSDFGLIWRCFCEYLQIIFFLNRALSLFYLYSPLTSCKKSEKCLEPFLRKLRYQPTNQPNIKVSDFGLIWRRFLRISSNQ